MFRWCIISWITFQDNKVAVLQNSLLLKGVSLMYNFVGCIGVEFVQFHGLLQETSDDLFSNYSLREFTLSGPFTLKANRPLAVFSLTVGVNHEAKFAGIRRLKVWRHISGLHMFQHQDLVVFLRKFPQHSPWLYQNCRVKFIALRLKGIHMKNADGTKHVFEIETLKSRCVCGSPQ